LNAHTAVQISALKNEGIDILKKNIVSSLLAKKATGQDVTPDLLITNIRHKQLVDNARLTLEQAGESLERGDPLEVTALLLRESLDSLGEIIGAVTTEDILDRIFSEFCIGK
jgi:tRNA modification GTPase